MKNKLTIFLVLVCQIICAQNKGYYITNNGERHSCLIKGYFLNDKAEAFKYSSTESPERFSSFNINEIKEFGIKNKFKFQRFSVKVEFIDNNISNLDNKLKTNLKNRTIYLKKVVEGEINIFSCTKRTRTIMFISKGKNIPEQLYYKVYAVGKKDKNKKNGAIEHFCRYKYQLNYYANNDEFMYKRTKKLNYNSNDIVRLVTDYNKYKNQSKWSEKDLWPKWIYLNIESGISTSKLYKSGITYNNSNPFDLSLSFGIECSFKSFKNINLIANFTYRNIFYNYYFKIGNSILPLYAVYNGFDLNIGGRYYHKLTKKSKIFTELTIQPIHAGIIKKINNIFYSQEDYFKDFKHNQRYNKDYVGQLNLNNAIGIGIGYMYNNKYYCKLKYSYLKENFILKNNRFSSQNIEFSLGIRL